MGLRIGVEPLTARERDILRLTAERLSVPEIARAIGRTPGSVRTDLLSAFEKLGVTDRAAAVEAAERDGLI
jgi:two-component system, NarL family, nitrate/nitrite response regulator NarL